MTKLFLDGYEIEIGENQIRQTFQRNSLGDVRTRQLNFTNTFKAFHTIKNETFFGYLNEINSTSDKPYRFMESKIVVDGLEINTGTAIVRRSNSEYLEIYVYSGINGLYENINNKSIRDLDFLGINHTITEGIVTSTFDESQPYIYALSNQTNQINQQAYLETWLPSVYEWWLFEKIINEAGFTYEGDLFNTSEFKSPVINPVTYDENQSNLLVKDFSKFMPDILQTEFIRDILFRYGLMFDKERGTNNLVFKQIKDVFRDREGSIDWSEKYAGQGTTQFTLGNYGIRNYFRYSDRDGYSKNADGFFELDVENLDQQKTIATSVYTVNQVINRFNNLVFPIFIYDDADEISIEEVDPSISTIEKITTGFTFNSDSGLGSSFNGEVPYLRFEGLNMSKYVLDNYSELRKIANRAKVIPIDLYLDPIDIYNLDFFKIYYIREFSSYFYINKVSNFLEGRATTCEMVRIPPNVFSDEETVNTPPTVELFVDKNLINQGEQVVFTHNVADLENNIEKWELLFDGFLKDSGFGIPPSSITHIYQSPGTFNPELTVTDFEDAVGSGSVEVQVEDTFVVTFDSDTGEYNAPAGSTVVVSLQIGGSGDAESLIAAGTDENATIGQSGHSDLGSRQLAFNVPSSGNPQTAQFTFVMPSNGTAWFRGEQYVGPSGPSQNFTSVSISNNGEDVGFSVTSNNPIFP